MLLAWSAALALMAPPAIEPLVDPLVDGAIGVAVGVASGVLFVLHDDLVSRGCPCDRDEAPGFERFAVDGRLGYAEQVADATLGVSLLAPAAVLAATAPDDAALLEDLVLVYQSAAFAGLLTQIAKTSVGRPYPFMLSREATAGQAQSGANYASFWSGHTAVPMAAAVTLGVLIERRHPHARWRWLVWAVGPALALSAGAWQVAAANHYPSDVLVGGAVGAAVGALNPLIHGAF
mgnify:CR=1 FL=1